MNGFKENYPIHDEIVLTKSILGTNTISVCIFDENKEVFYKITKDGIDKEIPLRDSAYYWKRLN